MFADKRGAVENLPKWFVYFSIVIVVGVFIVVVVVTYQDEQWKGIPPLEVMVLSNVLRNNCLALQDEVKVYPNVIDPKKVNEQTLRACYKKESLGYRVTLQSSSGFTVAAADVFSAQQKQHLPICDIVSASFYDCVKKHEYVLYAQGEDQVPGLLTIEVVNRVE